MPLEFEWDEEKRHRNITKHGIDFLRARELFDGRHIHTWQSAYETELRMITVGQLNDSHFYAVIWTPREDAIRFISVRRARRAEVRKYREVHGL